MIQPFLTTEEGEPRREALRRSLEAGWDVWIEHRLVLRAVNEHWHEVPELREKSGSDVFERFSEAMGAEIDRERAAGLALPGPDARQLASALLWSTAQCTYVAGLGADPALPDERAIFDTIVSIWERAIYGASRRARPSRHARVYTVYTCALRSTEEERNGDLHGELPGASRPFRQGHPQLLHLVMGRVH